MQIQGDRIQLTPPAPRAPQKQAPGPKMAGDRLKLAAPKGSGKTEKKRYVPPSVSRIAYTGGAPALPQNQMDPAVIQNDAALKALYSLPENLAFLQSGYMLFTRVFGPLGAGAFFLLNIKNTWKFLRDPKSPPLLKAGIGLTTALSGVAAGCAARLSLASFNMLPMAQGSFKLLGRVAGVTGLGAGTLISALDTYNTFRDPTATPAQKAFSILGTAAAAGTVTSMAIGLKGPVGLICGISMMAFPLMKSFLGKNAVMNKAFGAVGRGLGWVKHLF